MPENSVKTRIRQVNKQLIKYYGIPPRNPVTPSPLTTLIGTILSQNTNDKNSYRAYSNLRENYPNWEDVLALPLNKLESTIRAAGLTKQKATAIKTALKTIKMKNGSLALAYVETMPDKEALEELTSMKGVGIKTAACVLLFSLNRNICPVDTHVHRTLNRIGIVNTSGPEKTFWAIQDYLPENSAHAFHTNLIRIGREFCRPAKFLCGSCPLNSFCNFKDKSVISGEYKKNDFLLLDSL